MKGALDLLGLVGLILIVSILVRAQHDQAAVRAQTIAIDR